MSAPPNTYKLSTLIGAFRTMHLRDSITPEALGFLLQSLCDLIAASDGNLQLQKLQIQQLGSTLQGQLTAQARSLDSLRTMLQGNEQSLSDLAARLNGNDQSLSAIVERLNRNEQSLSALVERLNGNEQSLSALAARVLTLERNYIPPVNPFPNPPHDRMPQQAAEEQQPELTKSAPDGTDLSLCPSLATEVQGTPTCQPQEVEPEADMEVLCKFSYHSICYNWD